MAQVVFIDTGTLRLNNELMDVVSVHDDDVELLGTGYENFKVVRIGGLTTDEIRQVFNQMTPEVRVAYLPDQPPNKWTFIEPTGESWQQKEVWLNLSDSKWYFLEDNPKYNVSYSLLTDANTIDLENIVIPENIKIQLLQQVGREKIHLKSVNMTEAKDLN